MLEFIWGLKTVAMFDVWTYEHVLSGISVGKHVSKRTNHHVNNVSKTRLHSRSQTHFEMLGVLFYAYLWETIEHYLETGLFGERVAYWFQGVEAWPNRLITDPLMLLIGYAIARSYPQFVIPARVLSLLWLAVHIFVFPHSMYLHTLLA